VRLTIPLKYERLAIPGRGPARVGAVMCIQAHVTAIDPATLGCILSVASTRECTNGRKKLFIFEDSVVVFPSS
jgi:hypothetical protein